MGVVKHLNLLLVGGLLLGYAGCGNESKSKTRKSVSAVCAGVDCLSSVSWKLLLDGRSFPTKSRIDIDGTTVLNECVSKQKYFIDRSTSPESLVLPDFYVPKRGELAIDIIDMGDDCANESIFFTDDDVEFEVTKSNGESEILIVL
jgi:hypothetical protein